jgi:N,N-dimethylformamidase
MLDIVGYCDRWSLRAGESLEVMVSCETGAATFRADLVRLICGDVSEAGPGYKEAEIANPANGDYPGRRQRIHAGSYVIVSSGPALDAVGSFTLQALVWPTMPEQDGRVILGRWSGDAQAGYLLLQDGARGAVLVVADGHGRRREVAVGKAMVAREWYLVAASYDAASGAMQVHQTSLTPYARDDSTGSAQGVSDVALPALAGVPFLIGAREDGKDRGALVTADHFNGKIEAPRLAAASLGRADIETLWRDPLAPSLAGSLVAAWDFSRGISTEQVEDLSPNRLHGTAVNLPARGMKGHNWTGEAMTWPQKPEHYGAIHFHQDDLADAGWEPDFEITVPTSTRSGVYAIRLRTPAGGEDYVPFFVRPAAGAPTAPVAFLASTATYMAYADSHHGWDDPLAELGYGTLLTFGPTELFLNERCEFGLSTYDVHADGSGSCYSTRLRPVLNTRPKRGLWNFNADLHITDWLEATGQGYDVVTDEDLHAEGVAALAPYNTVVTCTHPEYHSTPMIAAIETYLQHGGRLMYLGGNGFYWRIAFHPTRPGIIETRRAENGTRTWVAEAGEYAMSFNGEVGGLWRNLGKPPQALVGIGYASEGFDVSSYYRRTPGSFDPRASFIFDGVGADEIIGNFGAVEGGAAGYELDIVDRLLGTPPHALVVAESENHSNIYVLTPEELPSNYPGTDGIENPRVRADMVFFETPSGGAVFSTGSIAWAGSLGHNGYDNNVARITGNVLRRFISDEPF